MTIQCDKCNNAATHGCPLCGDTVCNDHAIPHGDDMFVCPTCNEYMNIVDDRLPMTTYEHMGE